MGVASSTPKVAAEPAAAVVYPDKPPEGLKPCCACPETKRPRDDCIVNKGEENCTDLIEQHKECMRRLGFKV